MQTSQTRVRAIAKIGEDGNIESPEFGRWLAGRGYIYAALSAAPYFSRTRGELELFGYLEAFPQLESGIEAEEVALSENPVSDFCRAVRKHMNMLGMRPCERIGIEETNERSLIMYHLGKKTEEFLYSAGDLFEGSERISKAMTDYTELAA